MKIVLIEKSQEREDENLEFSGLGGSKVDLNGALAHATNWEEMTKVERGWSTWSVDKKELKVAARNWGKEVSDLLSWITTVKDQKRITELINSLKPYNVMDFLKWYKDDMILWWRFWYEEKNGNLWMSRIQNFFFLQLYNEYSFDNKTKLIKRVGKNVATFADKSGYKQTANKITNICNSEILSDDDIKYLSKCVFDLMNVIGK